MAIELVAYPQFTVWVRSLPSTVAKTTYAQLAYVSEHGRSAVLPDVRHRIQVSRHYPDMSEIRSDHTVGQMRYLVRILTCFVDEDEKILVCVAGNKAGYLERTGRDWYDDHVQVADQLVDRYLLAKKG